jgi:hypothetical protein
LAKLKVNLISFEKLSGLACNVEKTNILCIGPGGNNDDDILEHGFSVKENLTVLGMKISNNFAEDLCASEVHVGRKISENITRFKLSLPGRIHIAKTMLYSQINYLGCFLRFSEASVARWETQIYKYVEGNLKIGKNRAFTPVKVGGLGLFRINNFLDAQKIRWTAVLGAGIDTEGKKILNECAIADLYRYDLGKVSEMSPILENIIKAWQKFKVYYYKKDNNYLKAAIFGEPAFTVNTRCG